MTNEVYFENYLFRHLPELVGGDLLVIGQSSPFQPQVDLLALDCEGDLWFFELKAVPSASENPLQVLRYSQSYSPLSIDALSEIFERFTNNHTRSLAVAFCEYFSKSGRRTSSSTTKSCSRCVITPRPAMDGTATTCSASGCRSHYSCAKCIRTKPGA